MLPKYSKINGSMHSYQSYYILRPEYEAFMGVAHQTSTRVHMIMARENGEIPDIPSCPYQPDSRCKFKPRPFGKKKVVLRSFQPSWCQKWSWIHYQETKDLAFCHICIRGFKEKKIKASNADPAFVSTK